MTDSCMPTTVSAHDVQRNYRSVFNQAKNGFVVVLTNNHPDVAIVDIDYLDDLQQKARETELKEALAAIKEYRQQKKAKTLKTCDSLADLI